MARYKVARGTVRAAVNRLVTKGLVVVRGKSGTYVVEKKRITFAAILLHTDQPFHAAVCSGLANCAEKTLPASPKKPEHGTRAFKSTKGQRLKVGGVDL